MQDKTLNIHPSFEVPNNKWINSCQVSLQLSDLQPGCGLETLHTCILLQRRRMASTGGRGSTSCSIFTQFRRIIAASVVEVAMTMPGQSRSLMCLSKCTCWRHLEPNRPLRGPEGDNWVSAVFWALTWWRREWRQHYTRALVLDCWSSCSFPRLGSLPEKAAKRVTLHDSSVTTEWMRGLPTTPTVMAVFMSWLRQ